jgi:hypothetical protein
MAQAQGSKAYLALQKETTFGTDPGVPTLIKIPFSSESIGRSIGLETNDHITGNRNNSAPVRGNTDVAGGISFNLGAYPGELLLGALGSVATTGAGPYVHTIKVGNSLPSFTIEKGFADISQFFKYNGCKVGKFSLTATSSGFQKASIDIMGAKETASGTSFDATLTDLGDTPFDGFLLGSVLEGGSSISGLTEISLMIDNDLDGDTFTLGSTGTRGSINEGKAKVSGTIKGFFENLSLYNKAVNQTESSLSFTYSRGTGLGSAGNESVSFEVPELVYSVKTPAVTGPKGIYFELEFQGYYGNDADASALVVVLKNTQTTL